MGFCVECRDTAPGPVCYRCGATTVEEAARPPRPALLTMDTASALCYAGWVLTGVFFMILPPYSRDRTVRFHAYQSILMTAFAMLAFFCTALYVPMRLRSTVLLAIQIGLLTAWLATMASAWMGRKISLPLVGRLAEKQLATSGL